MTTLASKLGLVISTKSQDVTAGVVMTVSEFVSAPPCVLCFVAQPS